MRHKGFSFGLLHRIDALIFIKRIVIVVCAGHFLEYHTVNGSKGMPYALGNDDCVAWVQESMASFDFHLKDAAEDLERFLLFFVIVIRMPLARQLYNELLAITAIHAVDQHGADFSKPLDAIMM